MKRFKRFVVILVTTVALLANAAKVAEYASKHWQPPQCERLLVLT